MASKNTVTKTLIQQSMPLPEETVSFIKGIADDYSKVKNYVYRRYSGIGSVGRLTPVYSILNEMRSCGLRQQLNFPVVYYELAVSDAVADIKGNWGILKNKLNALVNENEGLTSEERMYIRTVLKVNSIFSAVLNNEPYEMPDNSKESDIHVEKCNRLIRRLVRRHLNMPKTEHADMFRVSPNGYKYKDKGIYLVSRVPRQRVFIPLKDDRVFDRQILIILREDYVLLNIPVETRIKTHKDYINTVYVYIGSKDMFTLSNGNIYGQDLEGIVYPETVRLNEKNNERGKIMRNYRQQAAEGNIGKAANIEANNLGRKKYERQKTRERAKTQDYINTEINRMISVEKPARIVITKPITRNKAKYRIKTTNLKLNRNFNGYIRQRLAFKCKVNAIELAEINSKGTGNICSVCGAEGKRWKDRFFCESCRTETSIGLNSAKNIENKAKAIGSENELPKG